MPLLATRRTRLTSSVFAVLAFALAGEAAAQVTLPSGTERCRAVTNGNMSIPDEVRLAQATIDRENLTTTALEVSNEELESSRRICQQTANRRSYSAQMCIGEASRILASRSSNRSDLNVSHCAYEAAARISGNNRAESRAAALEESARTLEAWRDLQPPRSTEYTAFGVAAADQWKNAVNATGNNAPAARVLAAARAYYGVGNRTEAERFINRAGTGLPVALLLVEIANGIDANTAAGAADRTALLERAHTAAQTSYSVDVALGTAYLKARPANWSLATTRLNEARVTLGSAMQNPEASQLPQGSPNYVADMYYGLAVLDARPDRPSWANVLFNVQRAREAGGNTEDMRRLFCLATIGRGGWDRNTPATNDCNIDATPQGQLMLGMYHLRRAQVWHGPGILYPGAQRENHAREIQAAIAAFDRGEAALPTGQPAPTLKWDELQQETNVGEMLRYGRSVVAYLCSPGTVDLPPGDANVENMRRRGRDFFQRHNAWNCAA